MLPARRSWTLALGIAVGVVHAGAALAETAREMLDRAKEVNEAREPQDVTQSFRMTLTDSRGGKRVRDLVTYVKDPGQGESKAITFFLSPPDVKGVGFLSWSYPDAADDQWLYLPALKRVRQITARSRRQSFQGSDFTYEDLELFEDIRDWSEEDAVATLVKESEVVDGVPCAVITLTPKAKDIEYGRFVLWLDRAESIFRKIELYDERGTVRKILTLSDFRVIDGIPTPHRLVMTNLRKNTKTEMEFTEVRYDQGLDDDVFTQRTLERGRIP